MEDKYDKLREKTKRIVEEGRRLFNMGDKKWDSCGDGCASCLAATARVNVDKKDFGMGFDSSEDVCMLDARNILAEELKLKVN